MTVSYTLEEIRDRIKATCEEAEQWVRDNWVNATPSQKTDVLNTFTAQVRRDIWLIMTTDKIGEYDKTLVFSLIIREHLTEHGSTMFIKCLVDVALAMGRSTLEEEQAVEQTPPQDQNRIN